MEEKVLLLTQYKHSCEYNLCSTPEFTQVTTAHRTGIWKYTTCCQSTRCIPDPLGAPTGTACAIALQLTGTFGMDARDAVLTRGIRMSSSGGDPHFQPQILPHTVKSNASRRDTSYGSATATCHLDGILNFSDFGTGIHYIQLKHVISAVTPQHCISKGGCFVPLLREAGRELVFILLPSELDSQLIPS